MTIKYRIYEKTGSCEIKCPHGLKPMVHSVACRDCYNFVSDDKVNKTIECKYNTLLPTI